MSELQHNPIPNATDPQEQSRRRNAVWIALVTGILMTLITAVTLPIAFTLSMDRIWGPIITATAAIVSFISAFISSRNRPTLGSGILISVILVLGLSVTFLFANNQGIALAAIIIFLVSTIATFTMPPVWVTRLMVLSVVLGVANILADFYLPNFGLPSDPRYTNVIAAVLSAIYIFITFRRFNQYSLRTKLAFSFILIVLVPVFLIGLQSTTITTRNVREQAESDLLETASSTAQAIDNVLGNELDAIRTEAQIIDLVDYLSLPRYQRAGSIQETRAYTILLALQRKNPIFISSYALLDIRGVDILDTYQEDLGLNKSDRDYFKAPLASGVPYISPVRISKTTFGNSIYFSAPVRNSKGDIVGILRSRYDAAFIQNILKESAKTENEEEYAVLVDNQTFVRIAHTGDRGLIFKTYQDLTAQQALELQEQLRLPFKLITEVVAPQPEVIDGIKNLENQPVFTAPSTLYDGVATYTGGYKVQNADWTVLIRRTERSVLAPIQVQTRAITVSSLILIVFAGILGVLVSQVLSRPIAQLAGVAAEITSGNLSARANIQTQDEIGELSNSFNAMTRQLQDTLGGLERRVAERTADVELARLVSERRAQELQAISEVSRTVSTEQKLDVLLPLVTRLVSEKFDFYHVGIFFVDDTRQFAVLQASNSEGGKMMMERGHKLEVGQTGIVGNVAQTGKPRIALDVGSDAVFFSNPDLPKTRSEMALPLNVRGQTIGVLDVQSTKPGAFTESDANTLAILADQVAIAIDNARLFGQSQEALSEVQKLYRQYQSQEWSQFMQQEPYIGYRQSLIGGKLLETPVASDEIQTALQKGEVVVLDGKADKSQPSIAIPVKLRGQTIGVLNIKAPTRNRRWNQDEINLAQAISDRLALALDNARLLQESQRRAAKEAKIGEVTSKIGASINMRSVLQTAVEELGRALPGSEVVIQFDRTEE